MQEIRKGRERVETDACSRICQIFNPCEIKDEDVNLRRLVSAAPSVGQLTGGRHQDTCELKDRRCFYSEIQMINRNIIPSVNSERFHL